MEFATGADPDGSFPLIPEGSGIVIRVLLVDDHRILRDGLQSLLQADDELRVSASAGTAREGLNKAKSPFVDVAVLDLTLPDHDGFWLLREIRRERPQLPVIILSVHSDPKSVRESFALGVNGYLSKNAEPAEVIRAIKTVHGGGTYLQGELAPTLLPGVERSLPLSKREVEVLSRLSQGQSNQQIADGLSLSVSAVKSVVRGLFEKLEVVSRTELAMEASRRGLLADHPS